MKAPEFYTDPDTRIVLSADRRSGAAVSPDGYLVSVFHPVDSPVDASTLAAAARHALKVNVYATPKNLALIEKYAKLGFRPAARAKFEPDYAPSNWLSSQLGEPDLVFLVKDPKGRADTVPWKTDFARAIEGVPLVKSIDEAVELQDAAAKKIYVSASLTVRVRGGQKNDVLHALAMANSVHGDGGLPTIPMRDYIHIHNLGMYKHTDDGHAEWIGVRDSMSHWPALTALHELGHFIDHQVLGERGNYASVSHADLHNFRNAVRSSEAFSMLKSRYHGSPGYLLEPIELWARAYAQYVVVKSGDPILLVQLERARQSEPGRQWSDQDFLPISWAIDKLLKKKGWKYDRRN